mmetsp:Transcript_80998/g.127544  ORF Transcript_80998/g.127544 Transcript_80998/m.127544 type:complete len:587 (+) Transcript_80998:113-1873(+)
MAKSASTSDPLTPEGLQAAIKAVFEEEVAGMLREVLRSETKNMLERCFGECSQLADMRHQRSSTNSERESQSVRSVDPQQTQDALQKLVTKRAWASTRNSRKQSVRTKKSLRQWRPTSAESSMDPNPWAGNSSANQRSTYHRLNTEDREATLANRSHVVFHEMTEDDTPFQEMTDDALLTREASEAIELSENPLEGRKLDSSGNNCFSVVSGLMVILNAVCVGLDTDYRMSNDGDSPDFASISEFLFCIYFASEISARLYLNGSSDFFCGVDYLWNLFDAFVVVVQIIEQLTLAIDSIPSLRANFSVLRLLRLLRVVRIMRLVRIFRLFDELRQIVGSMANSVSVLLWSLLILFLVIYMFAVVFCQCILDSDEGFAHVEVRTYFGSLFRTIFTMYESIVGGVNWDDVVAPLMKHISPVLGVVFSVYVGTSMFAIMNMLTGVFVDRAMQCVREDKDQVLARQIHNLFLPASEEQDGSREIDWQGFQDKMQTSVMQKYLAELNLNITEAEGLFDLLDADKSGSVSSREIVDGCLRLRGPARALELALLMREVVLARNDIESLRELNSRSGSPRNIDDSEPIGPVASTK